MDASDRRRRVAEEAAGWWVVLQGEASRAQREQYVDWLRESSVHVAEMLRVAQVHNALEQFQRWSGIPIEGSRDANDTIVTLPTSERQMDNGRTSAKQTLRRGPLVWAMAAMLIVITCVTAVIFVDSRGRIIQTDRGERRELALADGSVVQIDPDTRLRVKYEEHVRRVFLERGRALFHVAKNTERPFLVEANDTTVRAVGTAFAVERQSEAVVITVAEGKVAVFPAHGAQIPVPDTSTPQGRAELRGKTSPDAPLRPAPSASSGTESVQHDAQSAVDQLPTGSAPEIFLTANQQITVSGSGSAESVKVVDSGRALAWADGRVILENESVAEAVAEFNRYNRIQIVVNDPALARRPISGVFNAADPESFAAFLSSVARVRVTRSNGADITISAAK